MPDRVRLIDEINLHGREAVARRRRRPSFFALRSQENLRSLQFIGADPIVSQCALQSCQHADQVHELLSDAEQLAWIRPVRAVDVHLDLFQPGEVDQVR